MPYEKCPAGWASGPKAVPPTWSRNRQRHFCRTQHWTHILINHYYELSIEWVQMCIIVLCTNRKVKEAFDRAHVCRTQNVRQKRGTNRLPRAHPQLRLSHLV